MRGDRHEEGRNPLVLGPVRDLVPTRPWWGIWR